METPTFFGMLYHADTETSDSNYVAFAYGNSIDEIKAKFATMQTPRYREEMKFFEFGKDVSLELHHALLDEEHFYYDSFFWVYDELESILKLQFPIKFTRNYAL